MKPRFTVSILTYTALPQAKACIASVLKSTLPFELILTANGNPEAGEYFEELKAEYDNIRVIHNPTNQGFIAPNRFAFGLMETPFGIFLNDDATVPPDWLEKMVALFDHDLDMACVGQQNACCSLDEKFQGFKGPRYEYAEGSCLMVRSMLVKKIGLFSDYLTHSNCEDSDLSLRAREAGYHIGCAPFAIQHEVGATRKRGVPGLAEAYQKNLAACQARWADYLKSKDRKFPCEK